MELYYSIKDKPPFSKLLLAAFQQILSVIAGTITLPLVVGNGMSQSAALLGAGVGTIVYLLITKFKSPAFLGSSFSFVGSMTAAFAGAASMSIGYVGLLFGAFFGGLVYVALSIIVKFVGTNWINKIMPPVIIGPTVAIIGLTLSPGAVANLLKGSVLDAGGNAVASPYLCMLCGLITLFVSVLISVYAHKSLKLIPFIIGIFAGYLFALMFTLIGNATGNNELKIIDFSPFENISWIPDFSIAKAFDGFKEFTDAEEFFKYIGIIAASFIPVSFVCFAEHIADHKNLSFITGTNLLEDPGLSRTLLGDGLGSITGAILGGCPNTTYGESISCVALSKNASTITIFVAAVISVVVSFFGPLMTFFKTIPTCIVGGLSICLYGFIATSGFQMLKSVDFKETKNIFVVSTILVVGVGGLAITVENFVFSPIATALVMGILMNVVLNIKPRKKDKLNIEEQGDEAKQEEKE